MTNPDEDQEDELHLWAEVRPSDKDGESGKQTRLIIRCNDYDEVELRLPSQIIIISKTQWRLLEAFMKIANP